MMRIIGGREAGTRLTTPHGQSIRPTLDRVREAIFNRLARVIMGARVLDLFSGTGAMGLESISRGAEFVLSIERSVQHGKLIEKNIRACRYLPHQIELHISDSFAALRSLASLHAHFDIIIADPPFGAKTTRSHSQSIAQKLLDDPHLAMLSKKHSFVVIGHATRDRVKVPPHWKIYKRQRYGDATIHFLTYTTTT